MTDYTMLSKQITSLSSSSRHYLPLLSNASALLYESLENINWAGFYLLNDNSLMLGPFQGKVACVSIPIGKGVCGTAVAEDQTQLVSDVHLFKGHIACDSASESEIVIPLHDGERIIGVLDIDSPVKNRFSIEDKHGLETFVSDLLSVMDFDSLKASII